MLRGAVLLRRDSRPAQNLRPAIKFNTCNNIVPLMPADCITHLNVTCAAARNYVQALPRHREGNARRVYRQDSSLYTVCGLLFVTPARIGRNVARPIRYATARYVKKKKIF